MPSPDARRGLTPNRPYWSYAAREVIHYNGSADDPSGGVHGRSRRECERAGERVSAEDIDLVLAFVAGYCAGVSTDDFVPRMRPGPTRKVSRFA